MKIPFSPPFIDNEVIEEVVHTLNSGWITTGPKTKALESEIKLMTGCQEALAVNSWTSGAVLVLKWFGVGPGDEVIVPVYTYAATALSVIQCGATPIPVDVNDDFTIDIDCVEKAITNKTKVIIPVDFAGLMCKYDELNALVTRSDIREKFSSKTEIQRVLNRILILSDAAHSIGARYRGLQAGIATDITIFSLHAVKNITSAEGGVICIHLPQPFDNSEVYSHMRLWTLNGQTKDAFTKSQVGGWRYDILFAGLKVNLPDLCASVALAQLKKYNNFLLIERQRVANRYLSFFSTKQWAQNPILVDETRVSSYHLYPLRIKGICEEQRDQIIDLISNKQIAVNVHFIPLSELTVFKEIGFNSTSFPTAMDSFTREISLPIYPQLEDEAIDFICEVVEEAYCKASQK